MHDLTPLLGRTLVIVAHADDEAVACGALLQRMQHPIVVICTDGAPRGKFFWRAHGSRRAYAAVRTHEAGRALPAVGVRDLQFLPAMARDVFVDQELYKRIPLAMDCLREIATRVHPDAVLTLAYEGGHPDHDVCNFLGRQLADDLDIPAWEAPLYQRSNRSVMTVQQFIFTTGEEIQIEPSPQELSRKRTMQAAYVSQREVLAMFDPRVETVRPMAQYDYSRPPHEGALNYEAWGWPIRGWELCDQFAQYLNGEREHVQERRSA